MGYDYETMKKDVKEIAKKYPFAKIGSVGKSIMEKDILMIEAGIGEKKLLLAGAYHGLEYITAAFLTKFADEYFNAVCCRERFLGYDTDILDKITLYIIPMVNPDGVDISQHGLDITNPHHRKLISDVGIHSFNSVWQANAAGVDINHNFDAGWKIVMEKQGPTKYGGPNPESEPETSAVAEFIRKELPDMIVAFHSQGEEIYYDFDGITARRSEELAHKMAQESGYAVKRPVGTAGFGGCKDWFINEFGKEGFTVEMGKGKNPLPMECLDKIFKENAKMVLRLIEEMLK